MQKPLWRIRIIPILVYRVFLHILETIPSINMFTSTESIYKYLYICLFVEKFLECQPFYHRWKRPNEWKLLYFF